MKYMVIDHSVVSYMAWTRMHSANYEAKTDLEPVEFASNFAELMCYLVTLIQPDKTLFLLDCPGEACWRHRIYDRYYHEDGRLKIFSDGNHVDEYEREAYYMTFDGVHYLFRWNMEVTRYTSSKLIQAAVKELKEDFDGWKLVKNTEIAADAFTVIQEVFPGYKKNRKVGRWDYDTPKEEFKMRALKIAPNFAPLVDGATVILDSAEADDLAYAFCRWLENQKDAEAVFVTTDTDWHQLAINRDNVSFYNPSEHEYLTKTSNQLIEALWVKLIGGDTSDNIPGTLLATGARSKIGATKAAKLVEKYGINGIAEFIAMGIDPDSMERNMDLISLKRIPFKMVLKGYEAIDNAKYNKPKYGWEAFHFDEAARNLTTATAQKDRVKLEMVNREVSS